MKRRVVITGIGLVTPLGAAVPGFWQRLVNGESGIAPIQSFDASKYPVRIAAEVRDWSLADIGENPRQWPNCPRQTMFSLGAGISAVQDAGVLDSQPDPRRMGVYLGCGEPFTDFEWFARSIDQGNAGEPGCAVSQKTPPSVPLRTFDPSAKSAEIYQQYTPNMPALQLAARVGAQGPNLNCIAACVSATQAIGQSLRMIRRGAADVMLCGGSHSCIHPFGVTGFTRLSALSQRNDTPESASRPFDRDRDGFVIGEGAAVLVAEEFEHARARGANIYGELLGYGSAQDAFRVTDTHPAGRGSVAAMRRALADGGLAESDIDYVNAHGTGTQLNDKVETEAFKQVFGSSVEGLPISSTKSMLGHATTACGAIELAACLLAMQAEVVPPTINLDHPDPNCDLDYIPHTARQRRCRHVLSNNIGFGGQNAALVVSHISHSLRDSLQRVA